MLNPEINKLLLSARPFQYLEQHELDLLINFGKIVTFANQDVLLQQGKISDGMYIIIEGKALIIGRAIGKDIVNLAALNDGNFFGEITLIEKSPSPASIIADGELKCFQLTPAIFDMLAIFFPETRYKIAKAITEEICDRLIALRDKIVVFLQKTNMISHSIFGEIIKSFTSPELTSFEAEQTSLEQIQQLPFFKDYSAEEFDNLLNHSTLIKAAANCPLINENDKNTSYYIILRGAVEVSIHQNHKVAKISVLGPQNMFGSSSYVVGMPENINYSTCERAVLLKITIENLSFLQQNNVKLWYKLVDAICKSFITLERSAAKLYIRLNSESYNR